MARCCGSEVLTWVVTSNGPNLIGLTVCELILRLPSSLNMLDVTPTPLLTIAKLFLVGVIAVFSIYIWIPDVAYVQSHLIRIMTSQCTATSRTVGAYGLLDPPNNLEVMLSKLISRTILSQTSLVSLERMQHKVKIISVHGHHNGIGFILLNI